MGVFSEFPEVVHDIDEQNRQRQNRQYRQRQNRRNGSHDDDSEGTVSIVMQNGNFRVEKGRRNRNASENSDRRRADSSKSRNTRERPSFAIEDEDVAIVEDVSENNEIREYQNNANPLCINTHPNKDKADKQLFGAMRSLQKKYPGFGRKGAQPSDFFDEIIRQIFKDGIAQDTFIRNYTMDDENDQKDDGNKKKFLNLAIRYKRTPYDYLSGILPDNKTLLFKGYVSGTHFVVTYVSEHSDEPLLPYEVECRITRYDDDGYVKRAGGNFLYDLAEKAASLNRHTKERLEEWKAYLDWRRTIVKKRMHSAAYVRVESRDGYLIFTLQFPDKKAYEDAKWLRKNDEIAAYDYGEYADSDGRFSYKEDNKRITPLGDKVRNISREGHVVGGHYEIDVVYDVPDADDLDEMSDEERVAYVRDHVLPKYPTKGFLAPLVIKDLSLFKRLNKAVDDLQKDQNCRSPNMAMWIFDVTQARLPSPEDRKDWEAFVENHWLNTGISQNPNQREAIYKMLETPDLCLVQGPPGTGKTTVIAEAIYQLARRGNRVLLASQSHDAVDNALDRLANCSEIRAIRMQERERDKDEERSKFSSQNALSTYYGAISQTISERFLQPWDENQKKTEEYNLDLRDFSHASEDLERLRQELTNLREKQQRCKQNLDEAQSRMREADERNAEHENDKFLLMDFKAQAEKNEIAAGNFEISPAMGEVLSPILLKFADTAIGYGVVPIKNVNEEMIRREPKLVLKAIARSCDAASALRRKLAESVQNRNTDAAIDDLKKQEIDASLREIQNKMDSDDVTQEEFEELRKERKRLRDEKESIGGSSSYQPSEDELALFTEEQKSNVKSSERWPEMIQNLSGLETAYRAAISEMTEALHASLDAYQAEDTESLAEDVKALKGELKGLSEEEQGKRQEIEGKRNLEKNLAAKYQCEPGNIENRIESEIKRLQDEWDNQAEFRKVWQQTLKKFTEKLNAPETAKYDKGYYDDTYKSSCNVVGITCTANMKELDDTFPDFDVVIIDEVSKATPPELLPTLMRAGKTILVGDHRQLPPVFNEYQKSYNELLEEIKGTGDEEDDADDDAVELRVEDLDTYRKMVTSSLFREYFEKADDRIKHSLLTQYRMHSDIQEVINRFYDGKLESGILDIEDKEKAHGLDIRLPAGDFLRADTHAYWVDSSKLRGKLMEQSRYPGSTSLHNIYEKYIILSVLEKINAAYEAKGESGVTVGVISFYGSQVGDLRKAVKTLRNQGKLKALKVDVNTVDRFQGKEKQIIITSLVCNTKEKNASRHVAAFERINVAFSRAQNLLIIVGAKDLYAGLPVTIPAMDTGEPKTARIYQGIIDDFARKGAYVPGEILISDDDVAKIQKEYAKEVKA